jgi:hypothetical protein
MDRIYSKMTAEQLSGWRWRRGLTVAEAAEALGISVRSFYGYLAGSRIPYPVAALCTALDEIDRLRVGRIMRAKRTPSGSAATHGAPATAAPHQERPATFVGPRSGVRLQF